uniref:V-type proton ATPase subunit F n=1 Tax=Rhabditophanes sp. KR3021 TaxID=114890 RepID=A0AC35TR11_9BILA
MLLAVIGDEDTVVGFLLAGIGEVNYLHGQNFLVVDGKTSDAKIKEVFIAFTKRRDIAIILINQVIANRIREVVDVYVRSIPSVLELPSREMPYDPSKDAILNRAKGLFNLNMFTK